jgi:hypothetical protein
MTLTTLTRLEEAEARYLAAARGLRLEETAWQALTDGFTVTVDAAGRMVGYADGPLTVAELCDPLRGGAA